MQSEDIQKELLRVEPSKALTIPINIEIGSLHQLKMNANKSEFNSTFNQVHWMRIANDTPYSNMISTGRKRHTACHFCGLSWTSEHRNNFPARGKKCNNSGIENHIVKVCRKPKDANSYPNPKPRVNKVEKENDQTDDVNQFSANYDPDVESN